MENPSERQVVRIWQNQLLGKTRLESEDGEPLEIIYPGRVNDDQGADFRDAVISSGGRLVRGDIEVHVNSGDWWAHQHHQNPVYNRVVLHVVMWNNRREDTRLQNGKSIPVLALHKYVEVPDSHQPDFEPYQIASNLPCLKVSDYPGIESMVEVFDRAGEERFLAKAAGFQKDLDEAGGGQSLYRGIMRALGYSKNKLPCLELADRVPLQMLESIAGSGISDEECLARQQALLLGTAGLLPSQCQNGYHVFEPDDPWIDGLERLWNSSGWTQQMSTNVWNLCKVRPNNSPIRRLVAMSYLILRYRERGIFKELINIVDEVSLYGRSRRLEKELVVSANGYGADHSGLNCWSRMGGATLIGDGRAADIVVNVLLPFTFTWSRYIFRPELEKKALALYRCYPRLAANAVERHMRHQLGIDHHTVNSAQRQQGLLHIYNTLCSQGRCGVCPLSQPEAGNHVQVHAVNHAVLEPVITTGGNHSGVIGAQNRLGNQNRDGRVPGQGLTK
jgi:hypothetical protein